MTPSPLPGPGNLQNLWSLAPFTEHKAFEIRPLLLHVWEVCSFWLLCSIPSYGWRKPICLHILRDLFSAGCFCTDTAGSCVLTPVSHALEGTLLLTFKGTPAFRTPNGRPLRAMHTTDKAVILSKACILESPGELKKIPDAWVHPQSSCCNRSGCGLVLRSFQSFPGDSTMQPRWWTTEIKVWWLLHEKSFHVIKLLMSP